VTGTPDEPVANPSFKIPWQPHSPNSYRGLIECLNAGLGATKYQCMNIVSAFIGVYGFQIHDMPDDVILVSYAVAAVHVTRNAGDIQCFPAVVAFE